MPHTSLQHRFTFALANGLHARPASVLVEVIGRFKSNVSVTKVCDGTPLAKPVDARSVLSLVGLDIKKGDEVILLVAGPDADATLTALREVIDHKLCETDELPPPPPADSTKARGLPIGLRRINVNHALGRAVCSGIATGQAVHHSGLVLPAEVLAAKPGKPEKETIAALTAMAEVQLDLEKRSREAASPTERELLAAHAAIAADPALRELVTQEIRAGATGLVGVARAIDKLAAQLRAAESHYIRDRAIDVQDVGIQIITILGRGQFTPCAPALERDSIVFAETLTPNQLLKMDRRLLKGLVLGRVGATSHTIILARSMSLPTLINVDNPLAVARPGDQVILDASSCGDGEGFVLAHISLAAARYYDRERRTQSRRRARLGPLAAAIVTTTDGQKLEVGANASTPEEAATGATNGADGVGLLRTELLFLDRAASPTEDEQCQAYSAVLRNTTRPPDASSTLAPSLSRSLAPALPVIIRTFDIGGDKPAPYIPMPREENPFLGVRGLRLYEAHPKLLKSQLRAILRAAAHGPIKIMAPMVATPTEAAWFRAQVQTACDELKAEGMPHAHPQVGAMIEIPAAALAIDHLAPHCDFFSLGTNDLSQYFLAADRGNHHPALAPLHNSRHPAFLRLLRQTVRAAKQANRWIGVCGEMAGDEKNLPLMLGLGADEISVAPSSILSLKLAASQADAKACRALLDQACDCASPAEVEQLLATFPWRGGTGVPPVIDAALIDPHSDALTKEEAIKDAVDLLHIAGRTEDPREVEEATWAREETYSTALGFGFAVPHCKSTTISAPSLAVLKLNRPIDWGSKDGDPVNLVFLLAVPAADTTGDHMKIFAKLARKLMHDEFRDRLAKAAEPRLVEAALREELELA